VKLSTRRASEKTTTAIRTEENRLGKYLWPLPPFHVDAKPPEDFAALIKHDMIENLVFSETVVSHTAEQYARCEGKEELDIRESVIQLLGAEFPDLVIDG